MTLRKIVPISHLLIFFGILLLLAGCHAESPSPHKYRVIHNNDGTDALGNYWFHNRPLTVDDINAYVDEVANSQVTTYMMCSGSDYMLYRSKYGRVLGDDLNGKLDCGCDTAAFNLYKRFYRNFRNLESAGTDLIAASLTRAKKDGMEAFITYRMNDLHFCDTTVHCPVAFPDFWYHHPEFRLNDNTPGWHANQALDFAYQEVRDHKLSVISEQLRKYDMIDGYDLDFMRFIVYFRLGEGRKDAPLITQLVKDIREKVDEVSAERGKKILLSVRVPPTIKDCLDKGLDVPEWVRLGLVDFVSIGVHWLGDPSLPVAKFINDLGNPDIPVYASIDDGGYRPREPFSHGMLRGMASHILSQGADGLYLFNQYYGEYLSKDNGQLQPEEGGQVCRVNFPGLLKEIGSLETLKYRNKIYCLCDSSGQYGINPVSPLPLAVEKDKTGSAEIYLGDDPRVTVPVEAILFFRLEKASLCLPIVNGQVLDEKPEYVALYDRGRGLSSNEKEYAFVIPVSCLKQGYNTVSFRAPSMGLRVKRLEIALKYGDVQTHGYF